MKEVSKVLRVSLPESALNLISVGGRPLALLCRAVQLPIRQIRKPQNRSGSADCMLLEPAGISGNICVIPKSGRRTRSLKLVERKVNILTTIGTLNY